MQYSFQKVVSIIMFLLLTSLILVNWNNSVKSNVKEVYGTESLLDTSKSLDIDSLSLVKNEQLDSLTQLKDSLTEAIEFSKLEYFETGEASWYGPGFQGNLTANGEIFDTNELTAAHKTLPFGTIVRVINRSNDLHVDVRINDRGPFIKGRNIDLSKAAKEHIKMGGTTQVDIYIISKPEKSEYKKSTKKYKKKKK